MDVPLYQVALLVLAALAAGTVDAIAGGGGLITLPALLACGLPPHLALGTNKGQSVFGSGAALYAFHRAGKLDREQARVTFPLGLMGSFAGAFAVSLVPKDTLRPLVVAMLVAAAVTLVVRKPTPSKERAVLPVARARRIAGLLALAIGAYDGFFGPGTGTFLIVGFVVLLGEDLTHASADAKVVNFASNLAAVALFGTRGQVLWAVALPMAAAQFAGGLLGARLAVRGGERVVRGVVLAVVAALVCKLAYDAWVAARGG